MSGGVRGVDWGWGGVGGRVRVRQMDRGGVWSLFSAVSPCVCSSGFAGDASVNTAAAVRGKRQGNTFYNRCVSTARVLVPWSTPHSVSPGNLARAHNGRCCTEAPFVGYAPGK